MPIEFYRYSRHGQFLGVLPQPITAIHTEELNGSDALDLTFSSVQIKKGDRILWVDENGDAHEHIASSIKTTHSKAGIAHAVYFENSICELSLFFIEDKRPQNASASTAITRALENTRWQAGTVDNSGDVFNCNFYRCSVSDAVSKVIELYRLEAHPQIILNDSMSAVTSRKLNLLQKRGNQTPIRFDYGIDIEDVTKTVMEDDVITGMYGYGASLETEGGGNTRRLSFAGFMEGLGACITMANNSEWCLHDYNGNPIDTVGSVIFDDITDKGQLLIATTEEMLKRTQPKVSYSVTASSLGHHVRIGDAIEVHDDEFEDVIQARIQRITRDLINPAATKIEVGNCQRSISNVLATITKTLKTLNR